MAKKHDINKVIGLLFDAVLRHYKKINPSRARKLAQMAKEGRIVIALEKKGILGLRFTKNYVISQQGVTTKFFLPRGDVAVIRLPYYHLFTKDGRVKWEGLATFVHELVHAAQPKEISRLLAEVEADLHALGVLIYLGKATGRMSEVRKVAEKYIRGRPHLAAVKRARKTRKAKKKRLEARTTKVKKVAGT